MIDAEAGDAADQRAGDDIGGVESSAQADLDDAGIRRMLGEGEEGGGGGDFEEARLEAFGDVEDAAEVRGKVGVGDQRAGQANTLVEADEVRAGVDVDGVPCRFQHGAQEGAGGAFAVGPGNVEDGRQAVLGVVKAFEQRGDALQPERVATGRERGEAIELGLDGGSIGTGVVGHRLLPSRLREGHSNKLPSRLREGLGVGLTV